MIQCNINNFATRVRCFRCQSFRPEQPLPAKASNIGDNDTAPDNVPSQFLLFRGLESSVSEELFAKGVAKLNKPSGNPQSMQQSSKKAKVASTTSDSNLGAKERSLRRVLLVRDRKTNESWRYGFAEYASIEDAQAALVRYNSFDRFTIASKQVLVSYIHAGVFVPSLKPTPANERFAFSPIGNPALKLQYWDEEAYVTEMIVTPPDDSEISTQTTQQSLVANEGLKSSTTTDQEKDKAKKRKPQPDSNNPSTKKATPSHLQFWSNRHAELHGLQKKKPTDNNDALSTTSDANSNADRPPARSYADPTRHCCYLCMRQFTSPTEINKHERLSDLHRANLKDEVKVKRAEHKLEKHGITLESFTQESETSKQEYRDRAKERRKIHGVVNKKGEHVAGGHNASSNATPSRDKRSASSSASASPPPSMATSKGASLLAKMGYTGGAGLGATGEGMTTPLQQDVYVAGVGLGAQGGKLGDAVEQAERNTKGDYGDWVAQGRDKMRERYRNM